MKGLKASGKRGKEGESSREGEPTGWRKGGWRGWRVCGYVWACGRWICVCVGGLCVGVWMGGVLKDVTCRWNMRQ